MRIVLLTIAWLCLSSVVSRGASTTSAAEKPDVLRVGASAVEITPRDGETLDPLRARAIVFLQNNEKAALIVCDLISVSRELTNEVRRLGAQQTGIPAENICLAATHTHNGRRGCEDLAKRIVQALNQARAAAQPVALHASVVLQKETISFNRRFLMKDGTVRFNPGFLNPDIVRPVGPNDPEVGVVVFRDAADGRPTASIVNFALHACTVGRPGWSADFPCFLERSLQEEISNEFFCVFAAGTCGDVNHFDVARPRAGRTQTQGQTFLTPYVPAETDKSPSPLDYEYIGKSLAATVKEAIAQKPAADRPALAVCSETIRCPLATYSEMDLAWAKEAIKGNASFLIRVRARRILALEKMRAQGDTWPVEIQVLRLGHDTAMVALPGEVFVELGMAIKEGSPFDTTLVVELAGASDLAYVPTSKAFVEGAYEVINSRLAPGSGEQMVRAALRMLQQLKSEL